MSISEYKHNLVSQKSLLFENYLEKITVLNLFCGTLARRSGVSPAHQNVNVIIQLDQMGLQSEQNHTYMFCTHRHTRTQGGL